MTDERFTTADDLETLAAELASLAIHARRPFGPLYASVVYEQADGFAQRANQLGYPSVADAISRRALADLATWPGRAFALEQAAARLRNGAAEIRQTADDDQRRTEEGDEQRDYAEERANAELLRPDDLAELETAAGFDQAADEAISHSASRRIDVLEKEAPHLIAADPPRLGIGAVLTLTQWTAGELLEQLGRSTSTHPNPDLRLAIARELGRRALELEELAELALSPMMAAEKNAGARVARMKQRGTHTPEKVAAAETEHGMFARAVAILRDNNANRRRIVRRLEAGE